MVTCPICGEPVTVGLPQDATVAVVTTDPDETDSDCRTASVRCPIGHDVHVGFQTTDPDNETNWWTDELPKSMQLRDERD